MTDTVTYTPNVTAAVGIGGGATLTCEIVYRCEGWVPRFTLRDENGDLIAGDRRWKRGMVTYLMTRGQFRGIISESLANALVDNVATMCEERPVVLA
jgi:hypothetical protein